MDPKDLQVLLENLVRLDLKDSLETPADREKPVVTDTKVCF